MKAFSRFASMQLRLGARLDFLASCIISIASLFTFAITLVACSRPDIISNYGVSFRNDEFHDGVDFAGQRGADVLAVADGVVVYRYIQLETKYRTSSKAVIIWHPENQMYTKYFHLPHVNVNVGDLLKRGDKIGVFGSSGFPKQRVPGRILPHVHLELLPQSKKHVCTEEKFFWACVADPIDPLIYNGGCFDPDKDYPEDRFVLTYPVRC